MRGPPARDAEKHGTRLATLVGARAEATAENPVALFVAFCLWAQKDRGVGACVAGEKSDSVAGALCEIYHCS